jgi:hypothetical protein
MLTYANGLYTAGVLTETLINYKSYPCATHTAKPKGPVIGKLFSGSRRIFNTEHHPLSAVLCCLRSVSTCRLLSPQLEDALCRIDTMYANLA